MKHTLALLALAVASTAYAARPDDAPAAECDGVKVATGPKGKGYSLLFADLQKVCGSKVAMCEVTTGGGLDNLNLLATKEADVGFVQVDTLNTMKTGDDNIAALVGLSGMHYNYLHVVVSSAGFSVATEKRMAGIKYGTDVSHSVVTSFTSLRGKPVALVGSAALLGRQLDKQLGLNMVFVDAKSDSEAFDMVTKNHVAAAFTVSAWPSGPIKGLTTASGLTLVPFDGMIGAPYKVKPLNYKNLAVYNVNSLGIPNIMVSRSFTGQRAANVNNLRNCMLANLNELKEGNFQPAWNEVKPTELNGVTPFTFKK